MSKITKRQSKIILGIESSCDETAAAVIKGPSFAEASEGKGVQLLSNVVASSAEIQAKYGGIIPEQAAREQLKSIIPVVQEALHRAQITYDELDAIAVTQGPGLIGSLLVGVETAKTLSLLWNKPLIPINHLIAHFYGNWVVSPLEDSKTCNRTDEQTRYETPTFPIIGLLISGGHTDLILMKGHGQYDYLGGTRDDAAGEAFDKTARLLGLPYPGGPQLSKLAQKGDPKAFKLPRPMLDSGDFDFSFSGLKTAVVNLVSSEGWLARGTPNECPQGENRPRTSVGGKARQDPEQKRDDLAASIEAAIVEVLIKKTVAAAQRYNIDQIMIAGGVAANQTLRAAFEKSFHGKFFVPSLDLCTDNGVTVATAAHFNFNPKELLTIQANPNLSLLKIS